MSRQAPCGVDAAQSTCRPRASSTTTGPAFCTLEISHACRLRQKLRRQGDAFVVNVWGVGYRLIDGPLHQEEGRSSGESAA
jgi:hypothetical protein